MYNSYIYNRNQSKAKEKQTDFEKSLNLLKVQQVLREQLLKKHKFRIAHKILELVSDPVPVAHKVRIKSQKLIGESFMRLRPKDSKARIKEALEQNIIFDSEPLSSHQSEFRPRNKEMEIQSDMKFKPKDRYQRLVDKWLSEKQMISSWELSSDAGNSIRSTTKKLYFKSVETVALNVSPESCSKDNSRTLLKEISEESGNEEFYVNDDEKLGILAHTALEKCKLRPVKDKRYVSADRAKMR